MRPVFYCAHVIIKVIDENGKTKYLIHVPDTEKSDLLVGGIYDATTVNDAETLAHNKITTALNALGFEECVTRNIRRESCLKVPVSIPDISAENGFREIVINQYLYHLNASAEENAPVYNLFSRPPAGMLLVTLSELIHLAWTDQRHAVLRHTIKKHYGSALFPKSSDIEYIAPHEFNAPCVELDIQKTLERVLTPLLGRENALDVQVLTPEMLGEMLYGMPHKTINGRIEIRWSGAEKIMRFNFPFPVHGVFAVKASKITDIKLWTWRPRLVPRLGLWKILQIRCSRDEHLMPMQQHEILYRLGLPGARHVDLPNCTDDSKTLERMFKKTAGFLDEVIVLPHEDDVDPTIGKVIRKYWPCVLNPKRVRTTRKHRLEQFLKDLLTCRSPELTKYEEQDIRYQRLYTYSAFITERILQHVIADIVAIKKVWIDRIRKNIPRGTEFEKTWADLCIECSVVTHSEMLKEHFLLLFQPRNAIEAASQLADVSRYAVHGEGIKRQTAVLRQNHPSYAGYLCPTETPDSTGVGLTLHLARGVRCNVRGMLRQGNPVVQGNTHSSLGLAASLVPFYAHNDGARAMMGAKNFKQAMPVKAASRPAIATGMEEEPAAIAKPLIELKWLPSQKGFEHPGVDLLVAYMPWYGWNSDDGIVAGEQIKDLFAYSQAETNYVPLKAGFIPKLPDFDNDWQRNIAEMSFSESGLLKEGSPVFNGSILVYCYNEAENKEQALRLNLGPGKSGILEKIEYFSPPSPLHGGAIRWKIRQAFPLSAGDKLMGRHGNKGVISCLLEKGEMPTLPNDICLGSMAGKPIDLILNPHGVISRMNIGQLIETQLAFMQHLGVNIPENIGRAFSFTPLWPQIKKNIAALRSKHSKEGVFTLYDDYGRMPLCLPGEKKTPPVVVGIQHFYRLDHRPAGKAAAHHKGEGVKQPVTLKRAAKPDEEEHDAYSLITGQPVRSYLPGDRPQRVGEMEMWALAAHQARHITDGLLQKKSLPESYGAQESPTFEAIMAFLLAAGVATNREGDKVGFSWMDQDDFKSKATPALIGGVWQWGTRADYKCIQCETKIAYQIVATGKPQKSKELLPTIADVLRHKGIKIRMLLDATPFNLKRPPSGESVAASITLTVQKKKKIEIAISRTPNLVTAEFKLGQSYTAYAQNKKEILGLDDILNLWITCPDHKGAGLTATGEIEREIVPVPDGLADSNVYGKADSRYSVFNPQLSGWGYIELPEAMDHPLWEEENGGGMLRIIPVLPLRFRYPHHESKDKANDDRIEYRENLTGLYAKIIAAIAGLQRAQPRNRDYARGELKHAVSELYTVLKKRLFRKEGVIRRYGLGRRAHFSGRFVVIPDPSLAWSECRVPLPALLTWLGDKLGAKYNEILENHAGLLPGKFDTNLHPEIGAWIVRSVLNKIWAYGSVDGLSKKENDFLADVENAVTEYLLDETNQHLRVLLNRQPTLHRYNVQAFRPCVQPMNRGLVLSIHPLVCAGFNADFDGDTMALHFLSETAECLEAETLMPTHPRNLLSLASGKPTASYDQDMVLGTYLLSMNEEKRRAFLDNVGVDDCENCIKILATSEKEPLWDKSIGGKFMTHLCEAHTNDAVKALECWAKIAYEEVTVKGISFGFLELAELAKSIAADIRTQVDIVERVPDKQGEAKLPLDKANETLENLSLGCMDRVIAAGADSPGFGFATMAKSGARGAKQVRQIIGARGLLAPGDIGFVQDEDKPTPFFISSSLVGGMSVEETFYSAMNSRSSMIDKKLQTPRAGYLARRLVMACWDWHVKQGNCGQPEGSPATCRWATQKINCVCSSCYGTFPGYDTMDGFPAGLVAAQSISERGTQLSMRSFHTGTREISMDGIIAALEGSDWQEEEGQWHETNWFNNPDGAIGFVKRFKGQKAYEYIDDRHLLLLWRIIYVSGDGDKALKNIWTSTRGILSGLAGENARKFLIQMIRDKEKKTDGSAMGRLLLNRPFVGMEMENVDGDNRAEDC